MLGYARCMLGGLQAQLGSRAVSCSEELAANVSWTRPKLSERMSKCRKINRSSNFRPSWNKVPLLRTLEFPATLCRE